ncbi:kinase-like domain-containing protein, partial [Mycena galopus ATCC 62051]
MHVPTDRCPPTEPSHPAPGTRIDNGALELVEILGVGGYGVVYRAVETRSPMPRQYAVKCLVHSQTTVTTRQRQLHIREIALHQLASVHPNVVTLHRVVDEAAHTYIIMDFAPDGDLFSQILYGCRYLGNTRLIKHIFNQLLDAVEYCHSLGIYHRDLKPENVLCFDGGYRIAITDFGLATTEKLSEEFRTGSVYHMSPECQGGEFAPSGSYSPMFNDVWSLGIVLLNLATGRNPWKAATLSDSTFRAYLHDPSEFLMTVLPISAELNAVLVRMLELDWRHRMTIPQLRVALERVTNF